MKNTNGLIKYLLTFIVFGQLMACAGMPFSSMLKMRNLEPLETDPAQISIAIITHKGLAFRDGDTSLAIGFRSDNAEHNFQNTFVASLDHNPNIKVLQEERGSDENITLFYLAEEAANEMRETQNKIKAIRNADTEGEGSLSINVNTGCFKEKKPDSLYASIFVKFNNEQGYILMNRGLDLFEVAERSDSGEFWVECDAVPS